MSISDWSSDVCSSYLPSSTSNDSIYRRQIILETNPTTNGCGGVGGRWRFRYHQHRLRKTQRCPGSIYAGRIWVVGLPVIVGAYRPRSEERRVGNGGVSQGRSRWWS